MYQAKKGEVMQIGELKSRNEIKQLEKELIAKAKSSSEDTFYICDLELFIPKTVFNPAIFSCATDRMITHIPIKPGKSFLDLGCGCGLFAILAAKAGCSPVYATDINQDATHATEINVRVNKVVVRVIRSNLFRDIPKTNKFDMIWWHHPYSFDLDESCTDPYFKNLVDKNYTLLSEFLSEARNYLKENGKIYLPNSREIGCRELFLRRVHEASLMPRLIANEATGEGVSVDIFELHK